jgi:8-oxo-dGTP pyrophosphatase MutT (NUDIX family)
MGTSETTHHQAGVIAYRVHKGKGQVLLVTSRDTHRWIIPKGNIGADCTPAVAAVKEAYEEAGIRGELSSPIPLGIYTYLKIEGDTARPTAVEVYVLKAGIQAKKWPEKGERERAWMSIRKAAKTIQEPGIVPLLRRLQELEKSLAA